VSELNNVNFDNMTQAQFEDYLPDLFASSGDIKVSADPRFAKFLADHPDCMALVKDLETIADTARSLFEPSSEQEPADSVWSNIASKLKDEPQDSEEAPGLPGAL
jgi:hypothetical protein